MTGEAEGEVGFQREVRLKGGAQRSWRGIGADPGAPAGELEDGPSSCESFSRPAPIDVGPTRS